MEGNHLGAKQAVRAVAEAKPGKCRAGITEGFWREAILVLHFEGGTIF